MPWIEFKLSFDSLHEPPSNQGDYFRKFDDTVVARLNAYSFGHVAGHLFVRFITWEHIISQTVVSTLCFIVLNITISFTCRSCVVFVQLKESRDMMYDMLQGILGVRRFNISSRPCPVSDHYNTSRKYDLKHCVNSWTWKHGHGKNRRKTRVKRPLRIQQDGFATI